MGTDTVPSLAEAFSRFAALPKKGKTPTEGYQEVSRFVSWCGRDRKVGELSPAEVADYAQSAVGGGVESAKKLGPVREFLSFLKKEGWIETGLSAHLRVPRGRRSTARSASGTASQGAQLSQQGYDQLVAQVEVLKGERLNLVDDIKRAMEDKDFRENAPLDAAKERQGYIESKIRELEIALAGAEVVEGGPAGPRQQVRVGARVTLRDPASGQRVIYTLVDVREADVASGKISTVSPVGQALLDRAVGDELVITVPRGTLHYTIEAIGAG